jgi:hypothetical protein
VLLHLPVTAKPIQIESKKNYFWLRHNRAIFFLLVDDRDIERSHERKNPNGSKGM